MDCWFECDVVVTDGRPPLGDHFLVLLAGEGVIAVGARHAVAETVMNASDYLFDLHPGEDLKVLFFEEDETF